MMQFPMALVWTILRDVGQWLGKWKDRKWFILVVEDNPRDAELLGLRIQSLGWTCDIVDSAEAAIPLLQTKRHPVILIDMRLPHAPGYVLATKIARLMPATEIVIVAGEPDDLAMLPPGIKFVFIGKPVTDESLLDIFRKPKR